MLVKYEVEIPGLGQKIRGARKRDPRTLRVICARLELSEQHFLNIEKEVTAINFNMLLKIVKELDVDVDIEKYFPLYRDPSKQKIIIYIDDELSSVQMMMDVFESIGSPYLYKGFTSVREALEFLEVNYRQVCLVFLDVRMPEMSGIDVAQQLNELYPHMRKTLHASSSRQNHV